MGGKKDYGQAGRSDLYTFDPEKLTIVTDPSHDLFDERANWPADENLVRNVMAFGIKQPVIVRRDGDQLLVVAGRQRVKAALAANVRLRDQGKEPVLVPALMLRCEDADAVGVMVLENELRREDTVAARARKALKLREMGKSDEQIAVIFGQSLANVRRLFTFFDLHKDLQKAVESGAASFAAVEPLVDLPRAEQKEKLAELMTEGPLKGRGAREKAEKAAGKERIKVRSGKAIKDALEKFEAIKGAEDAVMTLRWVLGEDSLPPRWFKEK